MSEHRPGSDLLLVLERSRDRGVLGPGPVAEHIAHARSFLEVLGRDFSGTGVDLGSGGGLPGLALASWLPEARWLLVDASLRRADALDGAVRQLDLGDRVEVQHVRAEVLGRDEDWRGHADAVVARSFGPPGVVAECGAPLLRQGGRLVVSEPPAGGEDRWPVAGVAMVGLRLETIDRRGGHRMASLRQDAPAPARYPRRVGVPERSPLF